MEDNSQYTPESPQPSQEPIKPLWQIQKESWYDRVALTEKQLTIIIRVCIALLILTFVLIYLDAKDIFHLFGA